MREKFNKQLDRLDGEISSLGKLCEEEIDAAIKILLLNKDEQMENVRECKLDIEEKSRGIEYLCRQLLIRQQPVARDLNIISNALKLNRDMDRIGSQALELALLASEIDSKEIPNKNLIEPMANKLKEMLKLAISAYVKKDKSLAIQVIKSDDKLDSAFKEIKNELKTSVFSDEEETSNAIDILMIAKYIERIGDHAVNIADWVIDIS